MINKLETIDNEFRFFKMELLAGEPDYIVEAVCVILLLYWRLLIEADSMSQIANSNSTSPKCTGIRDCTPNMNG